MAAQPPAQGNVTAVYDLLERILPGTSSHFTFSLASSCPGTSALSCFRITDGAGGTTAVLGTSASELTAGLGVYMKEYCNMTFGWKRGGGNNIFTPSVWPLVGAAGVTRSRNTPFSYIDNVCTHSYTKVWWSWNDWQEHIDWMALSGINMMLAMTGQELVQYKVFTSYGLNDSTIRSWFNGPAFLTWSRGQNDYGNNIAGPLPMSWMQNQWELQKLILPRLRGLGITFQLPGFQGNVPWPLAVIQNDNNITHAYATGWMNSVDPLFGRIADTWMQTLCADFGCEPNQHMQLDGYFNGGTVRNGSCWEEEFGWDHL